MYLYYLLDFACRQLFPQLNPLTKRANFATIEQIDFRNYKELTYVTR